MTGTGFETKMMLANQLSFTEKQVNSFDRFLIDGTANTLTALEEMFGLNIDSSDSTIEIAPAVNSEHLKHLGNGTLYVVSSDMVGEMQGSLLLVMRSDDFEQLSEMMRPVLSLLFLSDPDADLAVLDSQKPDWMQDKGPEQTDDAAYQAQMMDTLAELGNVLFGLYSKAIFRICALNSHHSVPEALRDPDQEAIKQVLSSSQMSDQLHLVIENEFVVMEKPIKLWSLISPTRASLEDILKRIESPDEYH